MGTFSLYDLSDFAEDSSIISGGLVGSVVIGGTGSAVSEGSGTEGLDSLSTTAEGASVATSNPEMATAGGVAVTLFGGISTTSVSADDGADGILILFRKDKTPYSAVEQRAKSVYNATQRKSTRLKTNFPCIIAKTQDLGEQCQSLLSNNVSRSSETLEALERCLEAYLAEK